MSLDLFTYFNDKKSLDSVSITELEEFIYLNPIDIIPKVLLFNKMDSKDNQEMMLYTNDRTLLYYLKSGTKEIPSIARLKETLLDNGTEANIISDKDNKTEHELQVIQSDYEKNEDINKLNYDISIEQKETEEILHDANVPNHEDVSALIIQDHRKVEGDFSNIDVENTFDLQDDEMNLGDLKKNFKKKKKKNKFRLAEFSGISAYSKWLLAFKSSDIEKKIRKEQKLERKKALEESANKSIIKTSTIISESLADLLASQGHLYDAKKMYEQLVIKYPEKSIYFAAKINQIIKI